MLKLGLVVVVLFAVAVIGLAINTVFAAALWNWIGFHTIFHLGTMNFAQSVFVGLIMSLFGRTWSAKSGS